MAKRKLTLTNGQTVTLNSDVSMSTMKKWKKDDLISKNFLGKLVILESNPKEFETDDLENAIYLSYLNGNNKSNYSQEEFEDLINYDISLAGELLSEMCAGTNKHHKLQETFKQATTKPKNNEKSRGKKFPK